MQPYDGSTPHSDRDRETFCQELIAGESLYVAFQNAGFKRPRGNAQRMQQEPDVLKRLEYLADRVNKLGLDEILVSYRRNEHRRALEHIANADRLSLWTDKTKTVVIGKSKDDKPIRRKLRSIELKPLDSLTAEERALIDGFEVTEKGAVKVLMPKRLDARAMLAKLDGLDKPVRGELTGKDGAPLVPEFTDEQRAAALAAFLSKNAAGKAA
jgi:hypothetical protein